MKNINFKFSLDQKVTNEKTGFTGIISICAIQGDPENYEIVYYIDGPGHSAWLAERLLKEAE